MTSKSLGLLGVLGLATALAGPPGNWLRAEDKPSIKSPVPAKPLPPAKPKDPLKPQDPAGPKDPAKPQSPGKPRTAAPAEPRVTVAGGTMPDAAVLAGLAKKVQLDFTDAPIKKVLDSLQTQTGVDIGLSVKDSAKDLEAKPTVTVRLKGVSASSALNLLLRDVQWSWYADPAGVVVSDDSLIPSVAEVYNVRDLCLTHPGTAGPADETSDYDYEPLTDMITGTLGFPPQANDANSNPDCTPFHGTLTITQDAKMQLRLAGLLATLRKARDLKAAQFTATVNQGFAIAETDDSAAIDKALATLVDPTRRGEKIDQLADTIRKTGIAVHVEAAARAAGLPAATAGAAEELGSSPIPLDQALETLFADGSVTYVVRDEAIVFTTKERAKSVRGVRVYPVGDLFSGAVDRDGLDEEYARLLDAVTRAVASDSWVSLDKTKSGNAYIGYMPQARAIVCDQTRANHAQVAELLTKLRKAVGEQQPGAAVPVAEADAKHPRPLSMKIYKLNADLPAEDFVAVVKELVEPKSWEGEAYIHGVPGSIVVKQTPAIHKRVEKVLIQLGAIPDPKKVAPSGTPTLIGRQKAT